MNSASRSRFMALTILVLILAATAAVSALTKRRVVLNSLQASSDRGRVEVEPLTLKPQGFEPSTIIRPHGRFILAIDNRSEMPDLTFRLVHSAGQQVASKKMRGRELRWRQLLDLPPGKYLLTESNHSQWQAKITITPR